MTVPAAAAAAAATTFIPPRDARRAKPDNVYSAVCSCTHGGRPLDTSL